MSRARSVSQLVGANTALGNTVITGTANVSSTLAAGNTTIMGTGYIQVTNATSYTTSTRVGSGLTIYNSSNTNSYAGIELLTEPATGNAGICGIAGLSTGSGDSALVFGTRGSATYAERMRIDASGRVTTPYQPAFTAYFSTNGLLAGTTSLTKITSGLTVSLNRGSHWSTGSYRFTAPVAGVYQVSISYMQDNSAVFGHLDLALNGASLESSGWRARRASGITYNNVAISGLVSLSVNDYLEFFFYEGGGSQGIHSGHGLLAIQLTG